MSSIEARSEFLTVDRKGEYSFYLKTPANNGKQYRNPEEEFAGYQALKPYLDMPKARLATKDGKPVLVIQGVEAQAAEKMTESHPEQVLQAMRGFSENVMNMWDKTKQPMDESKTASNVRLNSLKTLGKVISDPRIEEIMGLPLVVNGREYPTIAETVTKVAHNLETRCDRYMVLQHGDEHLGNILVVGGKHKVIDPQFPGVQTPSQAINTFIGGNYAFYYHYDKSVSKNGTFTVNFSPQERSRALYEGSKPIFRAMHNHAMELLGDYPLDKELLFANTMRYALGMTGRPGDISEFLDNGLMYVGVAVENYYQKSIV